MDDIEQMYIKALESEIVLLRKDAERYRWLRRESVRLSFSDELVSLLVANQSELDGAMEKET